MIDHLWLSASAFSKLPNSSCRRSKRSARALSSLWSSPSTKRRECVIYFVSAFLQDPDIFCFVARVQIRNVAFGASIDAQIFIHGNHQRRSVWISPAECQWESGADVVLQAAADCGNKYPSRGWILNVSKLFLILEILLRCTDDFFTPFTSLLSAILLKIKQLSQ